VNKLSLVDVVMVLQAVRLKSYESWPLSFMDPEEMDAAGFYYTGYGDFVSCPFCKALMGYWTSDDMPFDKHKQLRPNCSFVAGQISTDPVAP
jgi:hypothetical protein